MILKKSLSYLAISIVAKLFAFGIIIAMPKFLEVKEFGDAAIYITSISFLSILVSFGTQSVVPKYFFNSDREYFRKVVGAILLIVLFVFFLILILSIPMAYILLDGWVNVFFVLLSALSLAIVNLSLSYYRASENIKKYASVELLLAMMLFFLPIALMVLVSGKPELWLQATYASYITVALFCITLIIKEINPKFSYNKPLFKDVLKICGPLIPHSIALVIISSSDRFLIKGILGSEILAVYVIANNFSMIIKVASDAFMKAWSPYYFKYKNNIELLTKAKIQFFFLLLLVCVFYNLIVYYSFDYFFSVQYQQAKFLVAPLSIAYFIASHYQVNVPALIDMSITHLLSKITPLCALVNVLINLIFLEMFGIGIAIVSTIVSYTLLSFIVSRRVYHEKCNK